MTRKLALIFIAIAASFAESPPGKMTIEEAIHASLATPSADDLNVIVAESRVRFLEAMGRRRVELSPQLGLLAVANPFAGLPNPGAGLLAKQGTAPPIVILDARADLLAAHIAQRRRAFQREMEATSRFYDLAEGQRTSESACAALDAATSKRKEVERDLAASRITQAELIRHDLWILDRESECIESEQRRELAGKRLASWVGSPETTFRAVVHLPSPQAIDSPLRDVVHLVRVAMAHRSQPSNDRDEVNTLRRQVEALHAPSAIQLMVGGGQNLSSAAFEAGRTMVLAKLDRLDREKAELYTEMRDQVAQMKLRFETQRNQLAIAKRRLSLSREHSQVAAARYRAGLEVAGFRDSAETAELQAAASYRRLDGESRFTLAALMSVCGLSSAASTKQYALLLEPTAVLTASLP